MKCHKPLNTSVNPSMLTGLSLNPDHNRRFLFKCSRWSNYSLSDYYTKFSGRSFAKARYKQNSGTAAV